MMDGVHYFEPAVPPAWHAEPQPHGTLRAALIFALVLVATFGAILTLDYAGLGSCHVGALADAAAL